MNAAQWMLKMILGIYIEMDGGNDGDMGGDMDDSNSECEAAPTTASEDSCFGDILNTSIYHNSKISLVTSLLLVMSFALKHNLTDAALKDLLQLIYFVPTPNICITSLYAFKKFFHSTQLRTNRVYYCKVCKCAIEDIYCNSCKQHNSNCYFVNLCIKEQIQNLFRRPGFFSALQHRFSRPSSPGCIRDVYDGAIYRSLSELGGFLSSTSNISFQWNTDGVSLFKSSSFSMWPLYLKINELPLTMKDLISNKIIAGAWFGNTKPSVLKPLCGVMKSLFTDGLEIQPPELHNPLLCKAIILTGTSDLPAKSTALNMIGHNGFFACPYCEQPGETFSLGNGHVHVYPYKCSEPTGPPRTQETIERCSKNGLITCKTVMGITPPGSCLKRLPHYNVVHGTGIDYMHCVLLNIMRLLVSLWFDSCHHSQPWSCSKLVTVANSRLTSIQPPSTITCTPRSLTEKKYWKASEYRSFLFYYSLPVMLGLLPDEYYEHYALLCQAIYLLNSDLISSHRLKKANKLLHRFYYSFSSLYNKRYLTLNMHQLLHLADCVKNLGPLFSFSCFDHEHCNGIISKMIHSIDVQLCSTFSALQSMCALTMNRNVQMDYLKDILYSRQVSKGLELLSCFNEITLDESLGKLLAEYVPSLPPTVCRYGRLRINRIYHSEVYERPTKINNTVISYKLPVMSCERFVILYLDGVVFAVVKQFTGILQLTHTDHIFVCNKPGPITVVPVDHINYKVVYMSFNDVPDSVYVAKFPNTIECD